MDKTRNVIGMGEWLAGEKALVYQDPLTETQFEGEVVLMEKLECYEPEFERWRVLFLDDSFETERFIKPKKESRQTLIQTLGL